MFHAPALTGKGRVKQDRNDLISHQQVWAAYREQRQSTPQDIDLILRAAGLTPLQRLNTMGEVKRRLKVKTFPDSALIAEEHLRYLERSSTTG